MKISIYGENVLKQKSKPIECIDSEIMAMSESMIETMHKSEGVGLAAPQVGVNRQLILLDVPMPPPEKASILSQGEMFLLPKMPLTLLNPEIVASSENTTVAEEGCLSIPRIYAKVERFESIFLKAQMLSGELISLECSGFLARVVQHEIDHLNGVLFVDRLSKVEFAKVKPELKKILRKSKKARIRRSG